MTRPTTRTPVLDYFAAGSALLGLVVAPLLFGLLGLILGGIAMHRSGQRDPLSHAGIGVAFGAVEFVFGLLALSVALSA
jgi:hypothetical protein